MYELLISIAIGATVWGILVIPGFIINIIKDRKQLFLKIYIITHPGEYVGLEQRYQYNLTSMAKINNHISNIYPKLPNNAESKEILFKIIMHHRIYKDLPQIEHLLYGHSNSVVKNKPNITGGYHE